MTIRIEPSEPVTTWLTVPRAVPPLVFTVSPVVRSGSEVPGTEPAARTLCELAWAIPVVEAWFGPWLTFTAGLVVVVVVLVGAFSPAFTFAWLMAVADGPVIAPALTFAPAPAPIPPPPPCPPGAASAGAASAKVVPASVAVKIVRIMSILLGVQLHTPTNAMLQRRLQNMMES